MTWDQRGPGAPPQAPSPVVATADGGLRTPSARGASWILAALPAVVLVPRALLLDTVLGVVVLLLVTALAVAAIVVALLRVGTTLSPAGTITFRGVATTRTLELADIGDAVVVGVRSGGMTMLNLLVRGRDGRVLHRVQDAPANPTAYAVAHMLGRAGVPVHQDPRGVLRAAELGHLYPGAGRWSDKSSSVALVVVGAVVLVVVLAVLAVTFG